jgi:hypothetical protein
MIDDWMTLLIGGRGNGLVVDWDDDGSVDFFYYAGLLLVVGCGCGWVN